MQISIIVERKDKRENFQSNIIEETLFKAPKRESKKLADAHINYFNN
jgi:hypothetical protein